MIDPNQSNKEMTTVEALEAIMVDLDTEIDRLRRAGGAADDGAEPTIADIYRQRRTGMENARFTVEMLLRGQQGVAKRKALRAELALTKPKN